MRSRRGIALPMVIVVLAALSLLAALTLADAMRAWGAARLATDAVRARAASYAGLAALWHPPDVPWLCLQPPGVVWRDSLWLPGVGQVTMRWRYLGAGQVRGEVHGRGVEGGSHRQIALLEVDSLPADSVSLGCSLAGNLRPTGPGWVQAHPDG